MNRVIHAACRRDLDRLAAGVGAARDGDTTRARDLQRAYANLHRELKHHHEQEDAHVFPALRRLGVDTALIEDMDGEHHAMADALDRTAVVMQQYAATGSAADAADALASIESTRVVVERHLSHEEGELEPLMSPHLATPEWKAAEKALRKGSLSQTGRFFAWLTDGMDPATSSYLRSTIPGPVITIFSRLLGRGYHREIAPVWR